MSSHKCSVCSDAETDENRVLHCDCGANAHMMCYGVEKFIENWKCSPCKTGVLSVKCELCCAGKGAFKATTDGKWVHVICALFTNGVEFKNTNTMEPVDILKAVGKKGQKCDFCLNNKGVCGSCARPNCKNVIHITCAQLYECLEEKVN